MPTTLEIGKKLVDFCNKSKTVDAIDALYADDIVSIEAEPMPGMQQEMRGKPAIRGKNVWWMENHDIHSFETTGPWPHGDRFIVRFKLDVTPKAGPMSGKRMQMEEAALYTVKNGKIVKEEFFYGHGG